MQTITKHFNRFRREKRGVSTVITVMLSLVLVVIIVGNVFLTNSKMNQMDMEKSQENVSLTNIAYSGNSPWFTSKNQLIVNTGGWVSGTYIDTQTVGAGCETFRQNSAQNLNPITLTNNPASSSGTWLNPQNAYAISTTYAYSNSKGYQQIYSGYGFSLPEDAKVTQVRVQLDAYCLDKDYIEFGVSVDGGLKWLSDLQTVYLTKSETSQWFDITKWTNWTSEQLNNDNIRVQVTHMSNDENNELRLNWIPVEVTYFANSKYALSLCNSYTIDLNNYPIANIVNAEITLRYNISDLGETWFLQAFDWTKETWSNAGFNNTSGNQPTVTGKWNDYTLKIPNNYVNQKNGTITIIFFNGGAGNVQTSVSIDFSGAKVETGGTNLEFTNSSPETVHVVAVWIITSTTHTRYSADLFLNSGEAASNLLENIPLPSGSYIVKVVTERGNIAIYSIT